MIADQEWFSLTRMTGMVGYAASCTACAVRYASSLKSGRRGGLFAVLAAVQFFLLLDMAFDWRWRIHGLFDESATTLGVYGERRPPQVTALLVLAGVLVFAAIWIYRRFRRRPGLAMAVIGTVLSVGLTCCEGISYHYVDMVFYHMVGDVMAVSLLWIGVALVTCWGVSLDWRTQRNYRR
jgi:hypothetical protein